jgi:hypothetical protein
MFCDHSEGDEAAQELAITAFLVPVCESLNTSRREVFHVAALRVRELLVIPGLLKLEDYLQVIFYNSK